MAAFIPSTPRRHSVAGVLDLQLGALQDHLDRLPAGTPRVHRCGVLQLDLVDHVDTEVEVHGFIPQDVLELLCNAGHLVTATH